MSKNADKKSLKRKLALFSAKLGLFATSLLIVFTIAEVAMRVCGVMPRTVTVLTSFYQPDGELGWSGRPNVSLRFVSAEYDVIASQDEDGFRNCGLEAPIETDTDFEGEVIWCVGDSFTWGHGVADKHAWVTLLNASSPDNVRYRNLGIGGYSALQEYLQLKHLFQQGFVPDRVVLLYSSNDPVDSLDTNGSRPYYARHGRGVELRNYPAPAPPGWNRRAWLKRNLLVYNYLSYYIVRAKINLKRKGVLRRDTAFGGVGEFSEIQAAGMRRAYADIKQLCESHGVDFCVVEPQAYDDLEAICHEMAIRLIDISPYFEQHKESSDEPAPVHFQHDGHWTILGNQIAAKAIGRELEKLPTFSAARGTYSPEHSLTPSRK